MSDDARGNEVLMHQARAVRNRRGRGRWRLPGLRAPATGFVLSLLVLLSPDLTLAPLNAGEPHRAGPVPIDLIDIRATGRGVRHIETAPSPVPTPAAQAVAPDARYQAALDAARTAGGAHGIAFAAVRDGRVVWSGSAGRNRDGTTPLRPDDALVIGSVTKTFVAAAILQLVDEGRIGLDDKLAMHLPAMAAMAPDVTLRQLLNHTSGLADVFNDTTRRGLEEHPEVAWTAAQVLESIHAPWYKPGDGWAYANTNYFLLGLVIEQLSGASLSDELSRRFIRPLALDDTRVLTGDDDGPLAPAWATIFWASGAMSASASDLAHWGDALFGEQLLRPGTRAAMIKVNDHDYGLGAQRIELPGAVGYGHTGLLSTYTTLLVYLPESNVTLSLLVNRSHVDLGGMLTAKPG
ncbi:MAG: serine hydrolase domain-containing protein, partial [Candidatus Limnocylindria bacterium]